VSTDGLLLVDKPAGVTSHDVVNVARRALREKRIGHGGTLDPFATGLLVLLLGRATRLLPHLAGDPKVYEATVRFGAETDTEDAGGTVIREAGLPTADALVAGVLRLTGEVDQVPPAYSAKRVDGRRAYDLARAGVRVDLPPVRVRVDRWEFLDVRLDGGGAGECDVRITCGGGTYVRSLARDLGRLVGSAAHLTALRRTGSGCFFVADAVSLDALGRGDVRPRPALDAVPDFPVQQLDVRDLRRVTSGNEVPASVDGAWGALIDQGGALVAIAERRGDRWQPRVVLHDR
jgi:tRNA pseudouridine55 synthase